MIRQFADRFAAAAAVQDPSLMLRLRATGTRIPQPPKPHRDLGAPLIALAVLVALVWANLPLGYTAFWDTHVGAGLIDADLRTWVNVTWGIVLAYAVGKPLGIVAAVWASRRAQSCLRVTAFSAGVGFTVSLLIASRVFEGAQLDQARLGILATALLALASTARGGRVQTCAAR